MSSTRAGNSKESRRQQGAAAEGFGVARAPAHSSALYQHGASAGVRSMRRGALKAQAQSGTSRRRDRPALGAGGRGAAAGRAERGVLGGRPGAGGWSTPGPPMEAPHPFRDPHPLEAWRNGGYGTPRTPGSRSGGARVSSLGRPGGGRRTQVQPCPQGPLSPSPVHEEGCRVTLGCRGGALHAVTP